jgi:hypothetical protein
LLPAPIRTVRFVSGPAPLSLPGYLTPSLPHRLLKILHGMGCDGVVVVPFGDPRVRMVEK